MGEATILQILALSMIIGMGGAIGVRAGLILADLFEGLGDRVARKLMSRLRASRD